MLAFHTLYWIFLPRCYFLQKTMHRMFLEHWNRQKILSNIRQRFSCLLSEWIAKKCKNIFFRVLRCTWTGRINLKICLGYDINYLSIWPFMHHPLFPTRKASKLIFVCFQHAGEWHHPASWKQSHGHHPASWKQINVSFEAFLVGNQGWPIKGQMLR